jgi:hypothetical protein
MSSLALLLFDVLSVRETMPFLNLETWLLSVSGLELIVPIQDQKQIF